MNQLTDNGEPPEKVSRIRKFISFSVAVVFILSIPKVTNYFEGKVNFYIFSFFWFLLYINIQFFLNKKKRQPFEFKNWLKYIGYYIIVLLIGFNLLNFADSASGSAPEGFSSYLPVIIVFSVIAFLIGYGLHFVEKHSKM